MTINFNHLYYFYMVVKEGGMSSAARKLHVSQPALSVQIKHFEATLGEPLFDRRGKKLEITGRGRLVYGYACQMFALADRMSAEMRTTGSPAERQLRLGVADDIERPFSVRLIRLLLQRNGALPTPMVTLTCASHETLIERLASRSLDAVLSDRPATPAGSAPMTNLGVAKMPVLLVAAPGKSLGSLGLTGEIAGVPRSLNSALVLPSAKFRLRKEIDAFLRERGLSPHIVLESDLLASVVRAVVDGLGASFLPLPYLAEVMEHKELSVVGPKRGYWQHSLWLISGRQSMESNPILPDLKSAFEDLTVEMDQLKAAA